MRDTAACVYNPNFHFEIPFLSVYALVYFTKPPFLNLRLGAFLLGQLVLQNINPHSNAPLLARELQGVGQKVDEHLYVPPLVPKYRLNQLQIYVVVDLRLKLYLFLRGGELQNLKCLVNCA